MNWSKNEGSKFMAELLEDIAAEAVLGALASESIKVHKLAVNGMPRSGKPDELLKLHGISAACIARKVREIV